MASEKEHIALEVTDLQIGYHYKKKIESVADGINFSMKAGQLVGLVGSNGIGKSTLLRTLAGMQPSLHGKVHIKGHQLSNYTPIQLASELSIVLTEAPSSKNLSVLELVSLGRQPYTNWLGRLSENDKSCIREALTLTETIDLSQRKCHELSDGQLQRVMIARALAQDTPLIILDEPTTHLDIYHRAYVLKLLKKMAKESHKAILFSSHEIDLSIQLCDRMLIMASEGTFFNSPQELIKENRFDSLFPSDTVQFDTRLKQFIIKE